MTWVEISQEEALAAYRRHMDARFHGAVSAELDPRWNWVEVTAFGQDPAHPSYIKGTCRHVELEPVGGTVAAPLYRCGTCEAYLRTEPNPPMMKGQPL